MAKLLSSEAMWKEGGGYYIEHPEALRQEPVLPDTGLLRDRRILSLFRWHADLNPRSRVLEIGCGRSMWLPCLAREFGCRVAGIDIEPYPAELAEANLAGAGQNGEIYCRDAFDADRNRDLFGQFDLVYSMGVMEHFEDPARRLAVLARYLKPGGRIITTVPNLQGVNWVLQRLGSLKVLRMHVVYDTKRLQDIHRQAGFGAVAHGYVGFYDGFLSGQDQNAAPLQRVLHERLCRLSNLAGAAWIRAWGGRFAPELKWFSPHVYYVGRREDQE